DRSHWNIANITPKDPVTLGLSSQRELDALIAVAAKKAGISLEDTRFDADRAELIDQLRAERDAAEYAAEHGEVQAPVEITAENLFKR
ncbi:MAG: DUF1013 domain-containing protein, partial [Sphingomonadaceae bacterium]|nr:DUF1013 domain-containing protein [Sphingomonadaceae bacterium]